MDPTASASASPLLPGLPNDISTSILASLPHSHQLRLRSVSPSWLHLLSPHSLLSLRRRLRLPPRHLLALFPSDPSLHSPLLFDPQALSWAPLPQLPCSSQFYSRSCFSSVFLHPFLYVVGGSRFDVGSYPMQVPAATAEVQRIDLSKGVADWREVEAMGYARGSFACDVAGSGVIVVAGGGAHHPMCPYVEGKMNTAEFFEVRSGTWRMGRRMPRHRVGACGVMVRREGAAEEEFWVMGGFGEYRTVAGVVPVNVYCRDAMVLGMTSGEWREVGDMWEEGERDKLGPIAVLNRDDGVLDAMFMLDDNHIFRYDFDSNRWIRESSLRRKVHGPSGFVAMNGELYVLTSALPNPEVSDGRRRLKRKMTLEMQIYNPDKRKWRLLTTNPPFYSPIDFKTAVACTIQL